MLVPGALDQFTGGYLFDRRVVDGLRASGRSVRVVELPGAYPDADAAARAAATDALHALPDGSLAVIDGLALPGFADCLQAEAKRLRLLGFIHHPLSLETGIAPAMAERMAGIERRLWPMLRGLLCPSAHTARCLADAGVDAARIAVTPPGTERPPEDAVHQLAGAGDGGTLRLLSIGSVVPRKGHRLLVEALAGLKALPWRLNCIGSTERDLAAVAGVRAAIASHGLDGRVALAGEVGPDALREAWHDADVFVLPSSHEGYGMAYAEAMARGLPVIGTTAGAIPDTVPETAGLLVEAGDVDALRIALERLMVDAALRQQLAAGALEAAAALPDWPTAVRHWADAADRLAA
ncbi:MAG: glycosyltransferase family 4 protein [Rhodocyclaceae bacterium]|nr:glycosyltransferase family 4 protein [Rhodocyclaceae bacterium]